VPRARVVSGWRIRDSLPNFSDAGADLVASAPDVEIAPISDLRGMRPSPSRSSGSAGVMRRCLRASYDAWGTPGEYAPPPGERDMNRLVIAVAQHLSLPRSGRRLWLTLLRQQAVFVHAAIAPSRVGRFSHAGARTDP
jgi:hypothetical protein